MNWTTLVSVDELRGRLADPDLVVVDARFALGDPNGGEAAWARSRIPGARYAHLERDLSAHGRPPGEGRHPLPAPADFAATLGRLGIRPSSQVVVYDAGDGAMAAARLWWLLRICGHARQAVLDGGLAAWEAAGATVEFNAPEHFDAAPPYPLRGFDAARLATTEEVAARAGEAPGWLLDARNGERFRGEVEPIDRVAGHIPGARSRPFVENLRDGRFRPANELREAFTRVIGTRDPATVVLNCGSGVTACHNLLAMEAAGLHGARVYPPSWSGWIADPSRPVETGAGR
jgi:thiosulfate/3-mercaptopyruvate sulfurtransferase